MSVSVIVSTPAVIVENQEDVLRPRREYQRRIKARKKLLRALRFGVLDWVLIGFSSVDSVDSGTFVPHHDARRLLAKNKPDSEIESPVHDQA